MTLTQIASLGKELAKFLALFACCFRSRPGFALAKLYVQGLLSDAYRRAYAAYAAPLANCSADPATRTLREPGEK
jgi:hypothetical protein